MERTAWGMAVTLAVISGLAIVLALSLATGARGWPLESPERSLAAVGVALGGLGLLWSVFFLSHARFARRDP